MGLRIVPRDTNVPFTKYRNVGAAVSLAAIIGSIAALFFIGLNFGIDFKGGVSIEVAPAEGQAFDPIADVDRVRSALNSAVDTGSAPAVSTISAPDGEADHIVAFVQRKEVDTGGLDKEAAEAATRAAEVEQTEIQNTVKQTLRDVLGQDIEVYAESSVGPTVSGELIVSGVSALVVAVTMMLVYIWFRFEWQFSLGAILALVHDVILTIGFFCITQLEFSLSIIAALLTIIGYSMNDTVVVYDRVRENLRKFKKKPLTEVVDLSINQTLARTLMTSITTLIALISLWALGGSVLRGFSLALIWGVVIGTYSSVFIASPMLLRTGVKRNWDKTEGASGELAPTAP